MFIRTTSDPVTVMETVVDAGATGVFPIIIGVCLALLGLLVLAVGLRAAYQGLRYWNYNRRNF